MKDKEILARYGFKKRMHIDIETFSAIDLKNAGVYRYAEDPSFEIHSVGYCIGDGDIRVFSPWSDDMASEVVTTFITHLFDKDTVKIAFNATFERVCLGEWLGVHMPARQWFCTRVLSLYCSLPASLAEVAKTLNLSVQKDTAGIHLINYFCKPCKPTKANGQRKRNYPWHDIDKWSSLLRYNYVDVQTERALYTAIRHILAAMPTWERNICVMSWEQNDIGIKIDTVLMNNVLSFLEKENKSLMSQAIKITGLANPNSNDQLKEWLSERFGRTIAEVTKESIHLLIENAPDEKTKRMLTLRTQMGKSSNKKWNTMRAALSPLTGRVYGVLDYYKAHTGRWSSGLVQVHNMPRSVISTEELTKARKLAVAGDFDAFKEAYSDVSSIASQLIRTACVPDDTTQDVNYIVSDWSGIEGCVTAWYAQEKWRLDALDKIMQGEGHDLYILSAAKMFKISPDEAKAKGYRPAGKVCELALGFGGSVGALAQMQQSQHLDLGLSEIEQKTLVNKWRKASPSIAQFWYDLEKMAKQAMRRRGTFISMSKYPLTFVKRDDFLYIFLPSGRPLTYYKPYIAEGKYGETLFYQGMAENGKGGRAWGRVSTWGGKLCENAVQATARDLLAGALLRAHRSGWKIPFHVHDEIIGEEHSRTRQLTNLYDVMRYKPLWAQDIPLGVDGFTSKFYRK